MAVVISVLGFAMTDLIKRAMLHSVVNIGQLSGSEINELNRAVKKGWLAKGKGGGYPVLKTVWAFPGYDFVGERKLWIEYMLSLAAIDLKNSTARVK